jgi:hypothetical protein
LEGTPIQTIGNVLIIQPFTPLCEENHEEKLKSLEKTRAAALEMAKEEDETPKESAEDAKGIGLAGFILTMWEYGVTRYPRWLQLQG